MKHYVAGQVVVVTGGSSGFGLEAARLLLEMGAKVVITGRDRARLDRAERELASERLLAVRADATRTADWKRLVNAVVKRFGRIDVLVNNHGAGGKIAPVEQLDDRSIAETLEVNLASVIRGCREVLPVMKRRKAGLIVNVSSVCAHHSWPGWGAYTAAKAGLVGLTRCLAVEMAPWGGRATTFMPAAARTGFCKASKLDDAWQKEYPDAAEFARTLVHCIDVPPGCVIEEAVIWGVKQIRDAMNPF